MRSARDADLLRVMAISSCSKQLRNTTVELAESSMAICRRKNCRFEPTCEVLHIWARCRIQGGEPVKSASKSAWRLKSCASGRVAGVIDFNQDQRCLCPSVCNARCLCMGPDAGDQTGTE